MITGLFKEFLILFSLIIIHELGHLLVASHYYFGVEKVYIYPFGGYIKFDGRLNRPIKEELLVLLGGPFLQIGYFLLLTFLHEINVINIITYNIIYNYHYSLLFFNFLPIFPLDGSKLINIIFSKVVSFKRAHLIMLYISYVSLFLILLWCNFISFNVNLYLLLILIFTKLLSESKAHKSIFNRFLLERYLHDFNFKKLKIVKDGKITSMMRDRKHLFVINNKQLTEKEILKKRFESHM